MTKKPREKKRKHIKITKEKQMKNKLCSNPHKDLPENFGQPIIVNNDQIMYGGIFFRRLKLLFKDKPNKKKVRMQKTQYLQRYGNMDFTVTIERGDKLN
jgi:hypothetical protein